jgi:uncharacterized protein DUF6600
MLRSPRWLSAGVMVALVAGCLMLPAPVEASTNVSFGFFYSNLSPHGSWLVSAEYGRVWQPYEYDRDWNPYYDGQWVYSDYGWTWVSDYRWGAIPYHYGTWYPDPYYGWVWVPGTVWAPSWVMFRTGPDYIGWCPVSPRFTVGASYRFGSPRYDQFVFVSSRDFTSRRIRGAAIRDHRRGAIYSNTRIVNNIRIENNVVVNRGPDVRFVERASGRQVRRYRIEDVSRVAPSRDFDRSQFRVDRGGSRVPRATEPIPKGRPLPSRETGRDDGRDVRRDDRREDARADRRDDRRDSTESRRDSRFDRRETGDRNDDRRPNLRAPSSGPEGRPSMREPDRSFDRDRRDSAQEPRDNRPRRSGQDRPDVRERDRERDQRVFRERREDRQPQMRERSPREEQRQRQERPRREERQRDQRKERPREHKPDQDKPPHGH